MDSYGQFPKNNDALYGLCQSVSKGIFGLKKSKKGTKITEKNRYETVQRNSEILTEDTYVS